MRKSFNYTKLLYYFFSGLFVCLRWLSNDYVTLDKSTIEIRIHYILYSFFFFFNYVDSNITYRNLS